MPRSRQSRLFKKILDYKICNTHYVKYLAVRRDGTKAWVTKYDFEGEEQRKVFKEYKRKFSRAPPRQKKVYEVNKILTHRHLDGHAVLLLEWKGYPHPVHHSERYEEDIPKCKEIIEKYWEGKGRLYDRVTGLRKNGQNMGKEFTFDVKMEEVEEEAGDERGEGEGEVFENQEEIQIQEQAIVATPRDSVQVCGSRIHRSQQNDIKELEFIRDQGRNVRFEVIEKLAHGGYGVVYKFKNHQNTLLAAKVMMWPDTDSFKTEQTAFSRIARNAHTNLLQLIKCEKMIHFGAKTEVFVLPLMGKSIASVMKAAERTKRPSVFPMKTVMSVASQIAKGMAHLQSLHIYHLDLKTDNVLFRCDLFSVPNSRSRFPEIKMNQDNIVIADYGVAALTEKDLREQGDLQPQAYRAPEAALNLPLTKKSDVWSLGVVMAEMYTAESVFYSRYKETKKEKEQSFFEMILGQTQQEISPEFLKKIVQPKINLKAAMNKERRFTPKKLLLTPREPGDQPLFDLLKKVFVLDEAHRPSFEDIQAETLGYERHPPVLNTN